MKVRSIPTASALMALALFLFNYACAARTGDHAFLPGSKTISKDVLMDKPGGWYGYPCPRCAHIFRSL